MAKQLTRTRLVRESQAFAGTGGRCQENAHQGFAPAFKDTETGYVYLSRCRSGEPAVVHSFEGLPEALVEARNADGRVSAVKGSLVAGFVRDNQFFTRTETAALLAAPTQCAETRT